MSEERYLIVNADDLGLSRGVNLGIVEGHDSGIVTSASLMVRQSAAPEGAALAAKRPALAIGLHIDLGQWDYEGGSWQSAYQRCPPEDRGAVEAELRGQLEAFRALLGRDPAHLDSHQHVHDTEPLASLAAALAAELGVPLRGRSLPYQGAFYGQTGKGEPYPQGIAVENLLRLISSLPPGWTELGCHPGTDMGGESSYASEREEELRALCDPRVVAAIETEGVQLRSFAQFG